MTRNILVQYSVYALFFLVPYMVYEKLLKLESNQHETQNSNNCYVQ